MFTAKALDGSASIRTAAFATALTSVSWARFRAVCFPTSSWCCPQPCLAFGLPPLSLLTAVLIAVALILGPIQFQQMKKRDAKPWRFLQTTPMLGIGLALLVLISSLLSPRARRARERAKRDMAGSRSTHRQHDCRAHQLQWFLVRATSALWRRSACSSRRRARKFLGRRQLLCRSERWRAARRCIPSHAHSNF